ncbi:MAG: collagen-like protein, partial [Candidatus Melainabacteria bacterium]|nr:collagen-like protein [Candidatus Melainabacteria bacterium]
MRNGIKILARRLLLSSLALVLLIGLMPAQAASRYVSMDLLSGSVTDLDLQINKNSETLDLAITSNIRIRIQPKKLYTSLDNMDSFRINVYEIINGNRSFVTSRNSTVNKDSRTYKVLSVDAGRFVTSSKTLEFDVFDTEGKLVNIYGTTLNATNLATQVSAASSAFEIAACEPNDFDCLIQGIFERVTIEAKKQRQATTGFKKEDNGRFKLTVPVPISGFKVFRGKRVNLGGSTPGGTNVSAFGETVNAGFVGIGSDGSNHAEFSYDPNNGLNLGFTDGSTAIENQFAFNEKGRLGIGVNDPQAFIHVRNSMNPNVPSMIIEPGSLTNGTPANGAIEFDGNNLYLTKGGVRSVLGATGAQGASGATGSQGPAGPAGADGTLSSNSGATVNGDLFVNGNVTITGMFNGDGSLIKGLNLGSATVNGGDITNVVIENGDINLATINGSTLTNNFIDGILTFTNNASILGDVFVNGTVMANFFNGDGSLITNINPANINGNVLNSDNATMAIFATNAANATMADFATNAGNADLLDGAAAATYLDNTDSQDLVLTGDVLSIEGGTTTVDLSVFAGSSLSDSE